MSAPDDGMAAVLLKLAAQAEHIGSLDTREAAHWAELSARLRELADSISEHGQALAAVAEQLGDDDDGAPKQGYSPIPAPRWWLLTGEARAAAIARLALWVENVYRPSYGHISASLGQCWAEHPLALFTLDWLSELHSVFYLQPKRSTSLLTSQAEWQTRLLPAAAEQLAKETASCRDHRPVLANGAVR